MVDRTFPSEFWLRSTGPAWPFDVRSIGCMNEPYPFKAERPAEFGFYIVMWTVEGKGVLTACNKTVELMPGTVFVIPPHTPHCYYAQKQPGNWVKYWFTCDGTASAGLMHGLRLDAVVCKHAGMPPGLLWRNLIAASKVRNIGTEMERAHIALRILYEISARIFKGVIQPVQVRYSELAGKISAGALNHASVKQLAHSVGLSRSHFSREFSRSLGISPKQFLLERKIEKARSLLAATGLPVKEVAQAAGWRDTAHFCRQFKNMAGQYPTEFRKDMRDHEV